MSISRVLSVVVLGAAAAVLAALGRWGRAHAPTLVMHGLPEKDRLRKEASVRRGGLVCYVASAVMVLAGALAVL